MADQGKSGSLVGGGVSGSLILDHGGAQDIEVTGVVHTHETYVPYYALCYIQFRVVEA